MSNPGSTLRWIIPSQDFSRREQYSNAAWHTIFKNAAVYDFAVPQEKYRLIFDQFVPGFAKESDVPVAAIERKGAAIDSSFAWAMCADPVEMTPNRHFLMLLGQSSFALAADEAQQLVAALNKHFSADGLTFLCLDAMHWIVQATNVEVMQSTPLSMAIRKDVRYVLPEGKNAVRWHSYLNEIQMLLFHHPVNQQRQIAGKTPVNSVWFWGGGCLPPRAALSVESLQAVCGASYFTRGLCAHFGLTQVTEESLFATPTAEKSSRVVLLSDQELSGPVAFDETQFYANLANSAEKLLALVKNGRIEELEVISLEKRYILRPDSFGWRRFFRRRR